MRGVGPDARSPLSTVQTRVKADGSFEMSGLLGSIVLEPGAPIPGWTLEAMRSGSRDLLDEPLALSGTENIGDIELVFSDRLGTLSGTTVDDRGTVSPGCAVVVLPAEGELRSGSDRSRLQRSDQTGRFVVSDLRPGNYLAAGIANVDPSRWRSADYRDRVRSVAFPVAIAARDHRTTALVCSSLP
jgi:hypothetical protein